ncbi:MAG: NAD(P)-dependent oxidoreductase [Patescibacteria group bacterium]
MSILILGGRGNLGVQLAKTFSLDQEVISLDRSDLDVLDYPLLSARVREIAPVLIINAVAYNAVDKCEDKEEYGMALRLNRDFPGVLADLSLSIGAVLIHYSSDYVFSGTAEKFSFQEEETPNPLNKYGESKFLGEQEILKRSQYGLKYYLVRTSKLFGPQGTSPQAKPSFFEIMLNLAPVKPELTVVNEELSCFTYTPDLAEATKRLWELEVPFGIYHLVNEGSCTWYDGVLALFHYKKIKNMVRPIRSEDLSRLARRPKFSVLENTKLKKMRNWKLALREYLDNTSI